VEARQVYNRTLRIVEYFLERATPLNVSELKDYDPSIEEIARDVHQLAGIIRSLASNEYSEESMAMNALQCCHELERLAIAVRHQRDDVLEDIFSKLDMLTKSP
jgi:nitrogen-specific signal transduction histidine kinase